MSVFFFERLVMSVVHLCYLVFELLFGIVYRIVDKINLSIGQDPNSKAIIGVLDIYGFESFKQNRQAYTWISCLL